MGNHDQRRGIPRTAGGIDTQVNELGKGRRDVMRLGSKPRSGRTHLGQGASKRVLLIRDRQLRGRHYGQRLMCAASTGRTHDRTDQRRSAFKNTLANEEPSTHDPFQTLAVDDPSLPICRSRA